MFARHSENGHTSSANFIRRTLSLCIFSLCLFASTQNVHGESLSPAALGSQTPKLSSTYLFSRLSIERFDNDSGKDSLPDYESWTGDSSETRHRQKPTVALFKSMLVPGLGQVGNRQYIKAALVIGVEGFLFMRWRKFRDQTVDAREAFEAKISGDPQRGILFDKFEAVRNDRNLYAWLTGTAIFLSMFDAFVDAHLYKFPGPGSEISFGPLQNGQPLNFKQPAIGATISFRF